MELFLLLVVIMLVFVGVVALFTKYYTRFVYSRMVARPLDAANFIAQQGVVPPAWRIRPLVKRALRREACGKGGLAQLLKARYIKRLQRLLRSLRSNTMLEREALDHNIEALSEVCEQWHVATKLEDIL